MILTAGLFIVVAAAAHGIASRCAHGNNKFSKKQNDFWGEDSWLRKYKFPLCVPKDNWYYKRFKISYEEKFFGSATAFVFLTDGFHFFQWVMIKALCALFALSTPEPVLCFFIAWFLWSVGFQMTYLGFKTK